MSAAAAQGPKATADLDALFEAARRAEILPIVGHPLYRAGRRWRGPCPLCGASKAKKADGAFSVSETDRVFKCFACGAGGDGVTLERLLRGGTARAAAERLAGLAPAATPTVGTRPVPAAFVPPEAGDVGAMAQAAARIWREAATAAASPVRAYLAGRGIEGPVAEAALARLRYHPNVWWGLADDGARVWLPAMVAQPRAPAGPTGGVHLTFLEAGAGGRVRKTARGRAKRMLGPQTLDGARGGAWLSAPGGRGPLVVGEGIESSLSAAMLLASEGVAARRVVATLSLGALQGGWMTDRWGRVDPATPAADPARRAFTWPEPKAAPWGEVIIALDRDMAPITVKVRRPAGGTATRLIDAEARAAICAGLAAQAWRAAGAGRVRAIAPGPGRDFNDELLARRMEPAG